MTGYMHAYTEYGVTGIVETKRVDFGLPGVGKTLCEIQWEGYSSTEVTVTVSVSTDGGVSWTALNTVDIDGHFQAFAWPWLTAESFIIRFQGSPLNVNKILLKAIPDTGAHIPEDATGEDPYG